MRLHSMMLSLGLGLAVALGAPVCLPSQWAAPVQAKEIMVENNRADIDVARQFVRDFYKDVIKNEQQSTGLDFLEAHRDCLTAEFYEVLHNAFASGTLEANPWTCAQDFATNIRIVNLVRLDEDYNVILDVYFGDSTATDHRIEVFVRHWSDDTTMRWPHNQIVGAYHTDKWYIDDIVWKNGKDRISTKRLLRQ